MKRIVSWLVLSLVTAVHAADPPELITLRTNYKGAMERAARPIMQAYVAQLERQRDSFARATNLSAANAVQAEIDEVKRAIASIDQAHGLAKATPSVQAAVMGAAAGKVNLLVNPSFEEGLTGWTFASGNKKGTANIDTTEMRDGMNSLRIDNPTEDDSFLKQTVAVKPMTRYRFTGQIKTKGVTSSAPRDNPHMGATLCLDASFEHSKPIMGAKNWERISFEFDTGNVDSVKVGPRLGQRATAGVAWFDELSLVEVGPARKRK